MGSVRNLTNGSGQNVGAYSYRPFGESLSTSGTSTNVFQYTAQLNDQQIGLYYLRARYYQPETGRFMQSDTILRDPELPQSLNRYSYGYNNPVKHVDPTGHAAEDLQYLEPNWFDQTWRDEFAQNNHREPEAVDFVYRFVTMARSPGSGYTGETMMKSVTIAIGAGLSPSGPGLWSEADYQAGMQERWNEAYPQGTYCPSTDDEVNFGRSYTEYRWGKVRIIMTEEGRLGDLVIRLGGKGNATTFSPNLIVFTRQLNFSDREDQWWLEHELGHVMQAQRLGVAYLTTYILMWNPLVEHGAHPMEHDANAFANAGGTGVIHWY